MPSVSCRWILSRDHFGCARAPRDEARKHLAQAADPNAVKRQTRIDASVRAGNSFGKVAGELIEKGATEGVAESALDKHHWLLKRLGAQFVARPVADISPQELLRELRKQERRGRLETAKQLRSFLSRAFRYAPATAR